MTDDEFPVREADLELTIKADKDAVYWVRPITVTVYRELFKANTRKVINKQMHRKEDETDRQALSDAMLDYAIVKWEGIISRGQPVPCTLEHKLRLPAEVQAALVDLAQSGQQTPEARAESFREPADVL